VCCIGGDAAARKRVSEVASRLRWRSGKAEEHDGENVTVAALVDGSDGPFVETTHGRLRLVHGCAPDGVQRLRERAARFVALESDTACTVITRDRLGLAPLFTRRVGGALWAATEVHPLLALEPVASDLDALAAYVAGVEYPEQTGWSGIERVLPAESVTVDHGLRLQRHRYWQPRAATREVGREEAVETLRRIFQASVERALSRKTAVLLSGGLDSAAVAVAAAVTARPALVTVSHRGLDADETRYAAAVADATGLSLEEIAGADDAWDPLEDLRTFAFPPMKLPTGIYDSGLRRASELGCDRVLDGHDGDGVIGATYAELANAVLDGNVSGIADVVRQLGAAATARGILGDFAPPSLRRLLGRSADGDAAATHVPYFGGRVGKRLIRRFQWRAPRAGWLHEQVQPLVPPSTQPYEESELLGARWAVDVLHPFADPQLVDFAVSLAHKVKASPARTKPLLRDALHDLLPPLIRDRPGKAEFSPAIDRRVDFDACYRSIRDSSVRLPDVDYGRLFRDAAKPRHSRVLWTRLTLAHAFVEVGAGGL